MSKEEGTFDSSKPAAERPMTEAEMIKNQKIMQKQAATELADYKKRLRTSNEVKELQVAELELGIRYYKAKVEFRELRPKMEELDALEAAEAAELKKKRDEDYKEFLKNQEAEKEKKPTIITTGGGKARPK